MKTLLQAVAAILLAVVGGCAVVITSDVHHTLANTAATMSTVNASVGDLRNTTKKLDATLDNVTAATGTLQLAAQDERKYWNQTSQESAKAMRDLRQITARLDRSVNDKLIPDIDREFVATAAQAQLSLESLQHSADTLTFQLNDPAIAQIADHVNSAAANVADASKNVADGTAHLEKATADIETSVHRLTRPPSMLKQIGMGILDIAAKLGSVAAGFVR